MYTLYPYDKSIFAMMRNPWWIVCMICSMWPLYGFQPVYYLVVFLCIDKTDEFQVW